jgi:hypothetical protein
MKTRPALPRLPWRAILISLATGIVLAWLVGFAAGMVVRFALRT